MNKTKKIFFLIIIFSFSFFTNVNAETSIEDLEQKKKEITNEISETRNKTKFINEELNQLNEEVLKIKKQLNSLNELMEEKKKELYEKNSQINDIETEIKIINKKISSKKDELLKTKEAIKLNLRVMYSRGEVEFLEFLFRSENVSEFLFRYETLTDALNKKEELYKTVKEQLTYIETQEKNLIDKKETLNEEKLKIETMTRLFEREKTNQIKLSIDLHLKKDLFNQKLKEEEIRILNLTHNLEETTQSILTEKEKIEEAKRELELDRLRQENYDNVIPPEIVGDDVVELAIRWAEERGLGSDNPITYSMPKRQLSMFEYGDCSTFTYRIFLDAGYGNIGLNTAEQISNPDGHFFTNSAFVQPGDLMFFGPTGEHKLYSYLPNGEKVATSHTGIYIGDNKFVDLSQGVGTIAIKDFSPGSEYHNYVEKYLVGYVRYEKP